MHLLFLGEFWAVSEPPPMLAPYWSLGYEVWYYVLFGVAFYLRGPRRVLVVLALLLLVGPKLWLLLPVWLAGVAAYRWQARQQLAHHWALAGWCATLLLLAAFKAAELDVSLRALAHAWWPFPALPLKSADRFLADYLVCVLVACNFVCARRLGFRALLRVEKPLRALASYTFTLYLVHALVMQAWLHLVPTLPASSASLVLLAALIGACTWLVGQVTEQRKHWFAALFLRLVPGMRLAPR
jgi:peptidoglycan/LPS O-acetylase OafA/YrhL